MDLIDHGANLDTNVRLTPDEIFTPLDRVFGFDWDAAASRATSKCGEHYFGHDQTVAGWQNALEINWMSVFTILDYVRPVVWCNPPYSRGMIADFCQKAQDEAQQGVTTVMLLPADISTKWYREFVHGQEAYVYKGRGKFGGAPLTSNGTLASAKFGSILRVFRPPMPGMWLTL